MQLSEYFDQKKGFGVLATADGDGKVNAAVYARPHFMEDGTVAFVMRDRLTRHNLTTNPYATYLFAEKGAGYRGKRLYLKKIREEKETELLYQLKRRQYASDAEVEEDPKFLVIFDLEQTLDLITRRGKAESAGS